MKTETKRPLLLLVLMAFVISINAQQPDTAQPTSHKFSVQQAVYYAFKNNVSVKNALLQVKIQ